MIGITPNAKVLIVVAHPDDEVLGCGATINTLVNKYNCKIKVVILGEGLTSRSDKRDREAWIEELEKHKRNIYNAKKILGYQELAVYDFPDNRFDTVALLDIIKIVEKEKNSFTPDIIFTHHSGDLNIDHQRTFQAVVTATRPLEAEKVKGIFTFETPSGTEWQSTADPRRFSPNVFIDLNEKAIDAKVQAMQAYEFESRQYPHPRSPASLKIIAQNRGTSIGKYFAEAFQLIRITL